MWSLRPLREAGLRTTRLAEVPSAAKKDLGEDLAKFSKELSLASEATSRSVHIKNAVADLGGGRRGHVPPLQRRFFFGGSAVNAVEWVSSD